MRTPQPSGARDAGLSLVELLVTMVVAGVLLPLVFGVVVAAQRHTAGTVGTADAVGSARLGLQDIDREVRAGAAPVYLHTDPSDGTGGFGFWTSFTAAGDQHLAADGTPTSARCIQYRVVGDTLRTRTFPASTTAPRPAWSGAGVVTTGLTTTTSFTADGPTTGAGTRSVRVVLDVSGGSARPATVSSVLTTRNSATADTTPCSTFS